MTQEKAHCSDMGPLLSKVGEYLDQYLHFEYPDAMQNAASWQTALGGDLPQEGLGIERVIKDMGRYLIPNGSQIPKPGCTSFICTGATTIGALTSLSGSVASPQRLGLTAFSYLEEVSLDWMAEMFELPTGMKGVYSSGGSTANIVALGAARQWAFEQIGLDPAQDGMSKACRIYASKECHHTIQRAAAVLGMGRKAVISIDVDAQGRMCVDALKSQLQKDKQDINNELLNVAVVANAGSTNSGAIDPLQEIGEIAQEHDLWFHIDGAYGLPGILDARVKHLYKGLSMADSVIVDPHKWLGAPIGIGATYVRDRSILARSFTQGTANYLEGSFNEARAEHSMDSLGIAYSDFGVELSAPSRGAVVWGLIREIGKKGLSERICRHNDMATYIAKKAKSHANLECVLEPTLSVVCFRFVTDQWENLDELNRLIHQRLVAQGDDIPSTTIINHKLVIRPCFIGARTSWQQAESLVQAVIKIGSQLVAEQNQAKLTKLN